MFNPLVLNKTSLVVVKVWGISPFLMPQPYVFPRQWLWLNNLCMQIYLKLTLKAEVGGFSELGVKPETSS